MPLCRMEEQQWRDKNECSPGDPGDDGSIDRPLLLAFSSQSHVRQLNPGRNCSLSTVDVERMISERGREKKTVALSNNKNSGGDK